MSMLAKMPRKGSVVRADAVAIMRLMFSASGATPSEELRAAVDTRGRSTSSAVLASRVQSAVAFLRDIGTPLVAWRKGGASEWELAPRDSADYQQQVRRYLKDAYVTACRGHRAIRDADPVSASTLQAAAVNIGPMLDVTLAEIVSDLEPLPMPPAFEGELRAHGLV